MADNFTANAGAGGSTFAADDVGGILYPRSKISFGVDGSATDVSATDPLPVVRTAASNNWGQALAITAGSTGTLASIASSVSGYRITGLVAHGTGDGYWFIQVASVTVLSGRTRATLPVLVLTLPNGIAVTAGSAVSLKVTNESGSTADYEATLLGA